MTEREQGPGYSEAELNLAQQRFDLRFPPDLSDLFRSRRPSKWYDWLLDGHKIDEMLAKPIQGMVNDARYNSTWWPEWGERPRSEAEQSRIVQRMANEAPKLIPLRGNRFIPEEPHDRGNPIFSVMGGDIIYYGYDLENFLENDGLDLHQASDFRLVGKLRRISFWSDAVERAYDPAFKMTDG